MPSLWAGLMKFTADFQATAYVASKVASNARRVGLDLHDPEGLEVVRRQPLHRPGLRVLLEAPAGSGHEGALRRVPLRHQERRGLQQGPGHRRRAGRRQGQGRLDPRGHARGPARLLPGAVRVPGGAPGHKASIEKHGDKWTEPGNIVSNGPFVLETWDHGKQMVLKKNPHFFGAKEVTLEKVVIPIIPFAAGVLPYENNEIDLTILQAADLKRFRANPKTASEVFRYPYPGTWYLTPQVTKPPFDNLQVRKALGTRWTARRSPRSRRASPCPPTA